jgi:cytochrome c-type biogenesis protein CcmH
MRPALTRPAVPSRPARTQASGSGPACHGAQGWPGIGALAAARKGLSDGALSGRVRLGPSSSPASVAEPPALAAPAGRRGRLRCAARLLLLLLAIAATPVAAVEPDEVLEDAALEARARTISQELRCLVCQNQSIDDSNAALAKDLRLVVRERLRAGDSDAAVLAFVEARYGEFVLLRPKLNAHTLLLWLAPLLLLLATALVVLRRARAGASAVEALAPLSPAEQQRVDELVHRERNERGL